MNLPDVDPKTIAEHEESVFSASISPNELYQELVASYCATAIMDLSPAQGEFCKACLASRTKAVAVCGTESHGSRLELLLTAHILGELSREGSTFFRPESVAKEGEGGDGKDETETDKTSGKKKKPNPDAKTEPKPKKKSRKTKKESEDADPEEEEEGTDPKPKKKPRKAKKENNDEEDEQSSEMW